MELKQYFKIIQKKLWLIAVIVIIACSAAAAKNIFFTTPIYQANAKLIVNQTLPAEGNTLPNMQLVQASIMMINSYKEIIKSAAILNKVEEKYPDLNVYASNISVSSASNSQVMSISYLDTSYERAAKKINAIAEVFSQQIPSIMKVDNVTILNDAILDTKASPINTNPVINMVAAFIVALLFAIGLVFLLEYSDHTYKSELELEKDLGIPLLSTISKISKNDMRQGNPSSTPRNQKIGEGTYVTLNQ